MNETLDAIGAQVSPGDAEPLARLNPAQREAVLHHEGPLLVIAGAGSGKTRVLTTRIARLIRHHGVNTARILAVTFTNKAAGEMRERIAALLAEPTPPGTQAPDPGDVRKMWCGTFHAIGARMLRTHAARVGRTQNFTIYDEDDTLGLIKRVMERVGVSPKQWTPKSIVSLISDAKNALVTPSEYQAMACDPLSRAAAAVYAELEGALRAANAVTFDDLLVLPVQVLRENPDVLEYYSDRFQFILADEYQDTNRAQFQFIKLLGKGHGNVAVVGDDDQSIYGWRGADIRNILDFEKDWPKAAVIKLEQNYRSTQLILDAAHAVVSKNVARSDKKLWTKNDRGRLIERFEAYNEEEEAEWIVRRVEELTGTRGSTLTRRADDGGTVKLRDIAGLYRTSARSGAIEEACLRDGIRYQVVGGTRFYSRREVKDALAYLRVLRSDADQV